MVEVANIATIVASAGTVVNHTVAVTSLGCLSAQKQAHATEPCLATIKFENFVEDAAQLPLERANEMSVAESASPYANSTLLARIVNFMFIFPLFFTVE